MKYLPLLVLCIIVSSNTEKISRNSVEEYFWRDYQGLVPNDAIISGKNLIGENTFVAQMSIRGNDEISELDFLPAIATRGNSVVQGVSGGREVHSNGNSNVKILCAEYDSRYTWHNASNMVSPDCHYVVVGQENLVPLHVGRVEYANQTLLGKVYSNNMYGERVFVPYDGLQLALTHYTTLMYCR